MVLFVVNEANRVENQVIMQMVFIDVSCQKTADIEFAWTREAAGDRGTHLGRHLIQSFAVGETTPEEAHKIGMELNGTFCSQRS